MGRRTGKSRTKTHGALGIQLIYIQTFIIPITAQSNLCPECPVVQESVWKHYTNIKIQNTKKHYISKKDTIFPKDIFFFLKKEHSKRLLNKE